MLRIGIRRKITLAIALLFLLIVRDGHGKLLLETDGIELHGTVRLVKKGAATCNVEKEHETEAEYERKKANDGKPLNVWRLDFSVYNGSGRPLSYMSAYFNIASEWPPCTNWTGPEGNYSGPVLWAGTYEVLQKPSGMAPGEEARGTAFLLVFHDQRPSFERWDVKFNFGEPVRRPRGAAEPEAGVNPARPSIPGPPTPRQPVAPVPSAAPAEVRNSMGMEFVLIPAGTFQMGSTSAAADDDERPVRQVRIVQAFYLGKYEVMQAQWEAVMGNNPSHFKGCGDCPVEQVSWEDAQAFIRKLNEMEGKNRYRLPSEAEWEYAARAGTTTKYSWGDEIGANRANCYGCGSQWDGETTAPVGSFPANAWGLHDMHGNVWEWVQDCWNGSYQGAPADGSAWESGDCFRRVLRGGSWGYNPWLLRAAVRSRSTTGDRYSGIGFRIVRTLTP